VQLVANSGFRGDTRVLLITRDEVDICDLGVGDELDDGFGSPVAVAGLCASPLDARSFVMLAGLPLTSEHPVWTVAGWQIIDPPVSPPEAVTIEVLDFLVETSLDTVDLPTIPILRSSSSLLVARGLSTRAAGPVSLLASSPEDVVYCPALDGGGTFVANGYVVGGLRVISREPM